jgi:alpha-glucuronidase
MNRWRLPLCLLLLLSLLLLPASARAETGYDAWLRYAPISDAGVRARYDGLPAAIVVVGEGDSVVLRAARDELIRGVRGALGRTLRVEPVLPHEGAIVLGTSRALKARLPAAALPASLTPLADDGYIIKTVLVGGAPRLVIAAANERGVLYGAFALLRKIALGQPLGQVGVGVGVDETQTPYAPVRMLNHWDNLDGTIERGYAGASIFFGKDTVVADLSRVRDYARLMASVGINACAINNVNANPKVITPDFLPQLVRVAEVFRPWGVRLFVSVDFSSPQKIGGLDTFDPLDPRVVAFWKKTIDGLYRAIPDFGGFVLKADSEGRLGPSAYGRTHADAANVIARPLAAHGGLIFYRGFIYDHHMDWRNLKNDRARAAYDSLHPLDGTFHAAAVLQIKHGPIDFQVREPPSPIFGGLEKTNQVIELQITQEYTGQQRHLCFLVPMWKQVLDFDLRARATGTPVKELVAGKTFHRPVGGFVGVANVGRRWLGHDLAMANLYGFGRLAWNPSLTSAAIADEWTRLTFGHDPAVVAAIVDLQLRSWPAYEDYTGPLGAGTLTDIIQVHYGPAPASSEENGWGQWHRADDKGVGMDRSVATGTGFIGQYRPPVAALFESLATCPDQLLLFMHHVPYTYRLRTGQTVIQHIYDTHYDGAASAADFVRRWRALAGHIDEPRYDEVLRHLIYQAGHAEEWRDAINAFFLRKSGIADARDRGAARGFAKRVEAESMTLQGYAAVAVTPLEAASGGKAVQCEGAALRPCVARFVPLARGAATTATAGTTATTTTAGWYDLAIRTFDQNGGVARFKLFVAGQPIDDWSADDDLPSTRIDAHTSTRRLITGIALRPGDEIRIEGTPDAADRAAIDYVEVMPAAAAATSVPAAPSAPPSAATPASRSR